VHECLIQAEEQLCWYGEGFYLIQS
jgi:hypothetical protein